MHRIKKHGSSNDTMLSPGRPCSVPDVRLSRGHCALVSKQTSVLSRSALVRINNHTPYQALLGCQPHLLPPLEGGYYGDLDVKGGGGQHDLARVREIAAISIIEATAKQRLARGDKRQQVAALQRAEYSPGDLVGIWYDPRTKIIETQYCLVLIVIHDHTRKNHPAC